MSPVLIINYDNLKHSIIRAIVRTIIFQLFAPNEKGSENALKCTNDDN